MTNNVSQTWSTIERVKDGSRLFSRNVFCEEQNVGVRLPRSKVLKGVGEGAGGLMIVEQLLQVLTGFWNLRKPCQRSLLLLLKILLILV